MRRKICFTHWLLISNQYRFWQKISVLHQKYKWRYRLGNGVKKVPKHGLTLMETWQQWKEHVGFTSVCYSGAASVCRIDQFHNKGGRNTGLGSWVHPELIASTSESTQREEKTLKHQSECWLQTIDICCWLDGDDGDGNKECFSLQVYLTDPELEKDVVYCASKPEGRGPSQWNLKK